MMTRGNLLLFVLFTLQHLCSSQDAIPIEANVSLLQQPTNKIISVHSVCSRQALMAAVVLREPFEGSIYARGYRDECVSLGNGSREISLTIAIDKCGTKILEKEEEGQLYEVYVYVQYEKTLQQAIDNLVLVQCSPEEIVVTGRMVPDRGRPTFEGSAIARKETTSVSPLTVDCWMEILKGRSLVAMPVSQHVNIGQDLTMVIKIKHADGVMARVTNCFASDGSDEAQQELIDSNGCSVDQDIVPHLQEYLDNKKGLKIFFSSFKAFKFPERDNLHLKCKILICNNTCPLEPCTFRKWGFRRRMSRDFYGMSGNILRQIEVYNSVEVQSQSVDQDTPSSTSKQTAILTGELPRPDELYCLNSAKMIAVIGVLLGLLLISLVVTICMCVRARELRRRLMQRQSFPYGRVNEYS